VRIGWLLVVLRTRDNHACIAVALNGNRHVSGVLRGFDQFMNIVLDATVDEKMKQDIGMVVSFEVTCSAMAHLADNTAPQVIRGNSIATIEVLESV
jgi:small nuclear ribonucleoprotein G